MQNDTNGRKKIKNRNGKGDKRREVNKIEEERGKAGDKKMASNKVEF